MKIAIIGADGQLGSDLVKILKGNKTFPLYYPAFDITKPEKVKEILSQLSLEIVINTAAFNKVDECEDNLDESFLLNSIAVRNLAQICCDLDLVLVHFSSDYVFDGYKGEPYVEMDSPNPLSVYGVTKVAGEYFVRSILKKYFLVRTCGLYGEAGCWGKGYNFVDAMISLEKKGKPLRVINDQVVTPTSTEELAQKINELIHTEFFGLYHLTNEGQCSWFEFASTIFSLTGKKSHLIPVTSEEYGAQAIRPAYSVLENKRAKEVELPEFSHWTEALEKYLRKKKYIS